MARHTPANAASPGEILPLAILLAILVTMPVGACSDSTGPAGRAARIENLETSALVGTAGEELAEPLSVRVSDGRGRFLAGAEVEFLASPEGGAMRATDPAVSDSVNRSTHAGRGIVVTTDSLGVARAIWELGYKAGPQTATAIVPDLSPLEMAAIARPGPPARLEVAGGHGQIGLAGEMLREPLVARLSDQFGNRVPDAVVDWEVVAGAGELPSDPSRTDASGEASARITLGPDVQLHTVRASYGTLEPVEFVALGVSALGWDDAGDTFSDGISGDVVLPDVVGLGAGWDGDDLVVGMMFNEPMSVAASGLPNRFGGLLDIDTDLNESTGVRSTLDINRPGEGSTGMGVDLFVDLRGTSSGQYVIRYPSYGPLGLTTPIFHGRLVMFSLPGDVVGEGPLRMGVVVATHREPTDIAPNDGAVLVGAR
jgi:hypothetical protein